nr:flagellin [uncultured Halomonas sp.]
MSVINTNITSMIGQQNLSKSQNDLTTSMERLSSGLRINSAKDDAAGQAIANRMSSQITGLSQAQRNANDGISVAQTAEGALNQVNDNLQRVRELTVQAQNGTNSQDDLNSIQDEINQRLKEINRISDETEFNGVKVLSEEQDLRIQVGANDGQTIEVSLMKINSTELNMSGFSVAGDKAATAQDLIDDFNATGDLQYDVGADNYYVSLGDNGEVYDATGGSGGAGNQVFVGSSDDSFVTFENNTAISTAAGGAYAVGLATQGASATDGSTVTFDGQDWTVTGGNADANGNATYSTSIDGETVEVTISGSGDTSGTNAQLALDSAGAGDGFFVQSGSAYATGDTLTIHSQNQAATQQDLKDKGSLQSSTVTVGTQDYTVNEFENITYSTGANDGERAYIQNAGESNASIVPQSEAEVATTNPLERIDEALKMVDEQRSELGAVQNRFESAITNLQTNETNLTSARSRIEDADYATEVANMTRAQILQQAGTSVLAQANQIPQSVLSLLG